MPKRDRFGNVLLLLAGIWYALQLPRFYVGHMSDDARDLLAAKALGSGGYVNLQIPLHPPLDFPLPGFPLFLAPFVKLVHGHWPLLKFIPWMLTLAGLVLLRRLLQKELSGRAMAVLLLAFAFNPLTVSLSGRIISDTLFLVLILGVLLLLDQVLTFRKTADLFFLIVVLSGAVLVRPEGILLIPSAVVALAVVRRWRAMGPVIAIPLLVWGGLFLRNHVASGSSSGYVSIWQESLPLLSAQYGPLLHNGLQWLNTFFMEMLLGVSLPLETLPSYALLGFMMLVGFGGMILGLRRLSERPLARAPLSAAVTMFCALYLFLHLFWLAVDAHYLWPIFPFLLCSVVLGMEVLWEKYPGFRWGIGSWAGVVALLYLVQNGFALRDTYRPPPQNQFPAATLQWISSQTPSDAFFLSPNASVITLYTGRYSMALIGARDAEDFRYHLLKKKVTHVVDLPRSIFFVRTVERHDPTRVWEKIVRWAATEPEGFQRVYQNPAESVLIYEVKASRAFVQSYEHYTAALQQIQGGSLQEGRKQLEKALVLYPLNDALNAYGATCFLLGDHLKEAQQRLQQAVRRKPQWTMAWINLARIYRRQGQRTHAREAYRQAHQVITQTGEDQFLLPVLVQEERLL